jgi:excisionase family DNA binding protein
MDGNNSLTRNSSSLEGRGALSVAEAAGWLGVSPNFLRLEIGRGRLRAARLGRRVVIVRTELDRYLAASQA